MASSEDRMLAARRFVDEWRGKGQEDEDDQTFWNQFLQEVMGIARVHHAIDYQKKVRIGKSVKRIDAYIAEPKVLIEQKSCGVDLAKPARQSDGEMLTPFGQAKRYASCLKLSEQPRWIVASNFQEFRIYDMEADPNGDDPVVIGLQEVPGQLPAFGFISDPINAKVARQEKVNTQAAALIGDLYGKVAAQYRDIDASRRDIAVLMVRILFCLYAEDSGLFETNLFYDYLKKVPAGEGQFRRALIDLFDALDTKEERRDPYLGETLKRFPYVDGGLFAGNIEIPIFTEDIKYELLQKTGFEFDWSQISPVIFGSIFESILSGDQRRAGGMHYTSPENIHKVIDPLFMDGLRSEYQAAGESRVKLRALQDEMASLRFLDPACGSGNFLTETYLELRHLENEIIARLVGDQMALDFSDAYVKVNVGQFYGIEINDFAISVAGTALWIADHQANIETGEIIGRKVVNLPLKEYHHIVQGNALRMDWNDVLPAGECDYVMGNPPFLGARNQSAEQKAELLDVFDNSKNAGNVDYVAGWYITAAKYIGDGKTRCAFVSTNSICQGEQVANVWKPMVDRRIHIDFAHNTFRWLSEANEKAHVFCVIVGFSKQDVAKRLFLHADPDAPAVEMRPAPANINAYLVPGPDEFVWDRNKPLCDVPLAGIGSQPIDDGNFLFRDAEKEEFMKVEPGSELFFHRWLGSDEFINGRPRWVLWLGDATPAQLKELPRCRERILAVRDYRASSKRQQTKKAAERPAHFGTEIIATTNSILIPEVSSERRRYIPMGFIGPETFCSNLVRLIPDATLYHYGILQSQMHNAWMRTVCGRLKSDYRYSAGIVYNNFVWPKPTDEQRAAVERCAQAVLDARDLYPESTLADMYDPKNDFMFPELISAHQALDKAVEAAYGVDFNGDEEKIVAHLFKLYAEKTKGE